MEIAMSDIANLQKAVETAVHASEHHARLIHIVEEQLRDKRIECGQLRQMLHALLMAEVGAAETPGNGPMAGFFNGVGGEDGIFANAEEAVEDLYRGEEPEGEARPNGVTPLAPVDVRNPKPWLAAFLDRGIAGCDLPATRLNQTMPSDNSDESALSYATLDQGHAR